MKKRIDITEIAADCFLELGYAETSVDVIARRCGAVKQTIYNYFTNKDDLFKAAIEHLLHGTRTEFDENWYALPPEQFFSTVAQHQLKILAEPKTTVFLRLLVKECRRYPELQHLYAESIPMPFVSFVSNYIARKSTVLAGENSNPDSRDNSSFDADAIAWCFRGALTGYATLLNLGPLFPGKLPDPQQFLEALSVLFARFIEREPGTQSVEFRQNEKSRSIEQFLQAAQRDLNSKKLASLSAAAKVFSRDGYSDASMDDLAVVASVSKQTVYKHFGSKGQLYTALAETVIRGLAASPLPNESLDLKNYVSRFVELFEEQTGSDWMREYFRLVFGETKVFPQPSGIMLLYIMHFGYADLRQKIAETYGVPDKECLFISLIVRNIIGAFILFKQIYVLGENRYLNEESMLNIIFGLLDTFDNHQALGNGRGTP